MRERGAADDGRAGVWRGAPVAGERSSLTLSPASFGQSLSLQQEVKVNAAGHTAALDAVLEISPERMTLVGMELGQRVLTLTYAEGELCEQRHPKLPAEIHGADVLSDLQLALWPAAAIRAALPAGWTMTETGGQRSLWHDGKQVELVIYHGTERWIGRIEMTSFTGDYSLEIQSAVSAP